MRRRGMFLIIFDGFFISNECQIILIFVHVGATVHSLFTCWNINFSISFPKYFSLTDKHVFMWICSKCKYLPNKKCMASKYFSTADILIDSRFIHLILSKIKNILLPVKETEAISKLNCVQGLQLATFLLFSQI